MLHRAPATLPGEKAGLFLFRRGIENSKHIRGTSGDRPHIRRVPRLVKESLMHKLISVLLTCFVCAAGSVYAEAPTPPELYRAAVDSDGVQRVRIVGGDYYFKPNHIIVRVGIPVEFIISRETAVVPHSLVLEAPEAGIAIDEDLATEPKKVTFTPSAGGKYSFYCRNKLLFFKSHRERGMEGVIEVVE
jgi:plastocyanin